MQYTTLGKTGLRVSIAGLGCGGDSRVGLGSGKTEAECIALVRLALDLGVNLLDTAEAYGTEDLVGRAIKAVPRDQVVITTKARVHRGRQRFTPASVVDSLEQSLRRLDTDYVDVFQLHGVLPTDYAYVREYIVPHVLREQEKGKFRHLGITEMASDDYEHETLQQAVQDAVWEVMMFGFNMMNQHARHSLFPYTMANQIGTLLMFVVRYIFSNPQRLKAAMQRLAEAGEVPEWLAASDHPLDFLIHADGASSVMDAAYRFVRYEPGVHVVLFGTSNPAHLRTNIASLLKPPLPEADRQRLADLFGHLIGVGFELPDHAKGRG